MVGARIKIVDPTNEYKTPLNITPEEQLVDSPNEYITTNSLDIQHYL